MNLKPMLAETLEDSSKLAYPVLASPKLDGIRCLIVNGQAVSRNLKPIRNPHVQAWVQKYGSAVEGLDGELISGEHDETVFNRTTSVVMSSDGGPEFTFWCFDRWDQPDIGYTSRMRAKRAAIGEHGTPSNFRWVPGKVCTNEEELRAYEDECLQRGFEGAMVRDPLGRYKYGRSTVKEALLLKVKRFADAEATVVGFGELERTRPSLEWRPFPDEPAYQVSEAGEVRSLNGQHLKGYVNNGYRMVSLQGRRYYVHRAVALAFDIITEEGEVDHINQNRLDNHVTNLRPTTARLNGANRAIQKNNTSGYKGVTLDASTGKWRAYCGDTSKRENYLGSFATKEEAAAAYELEARRRYGESATSATGDPAIGSGPVLGYLLVRDAEGRHFKIGSGFTAAQRVELWARQQSLMNRLVRYKHFEQGVKDLPRFPIFLGFRDPDDV